jgi:hypothetical protein
MEVDFHISKLNNLKVIHDLYSQCLTQTLSKTTSITKPDGVQNKKLPGAKTLWDSSPIKLDSVKKVIVISYEQFRWTVTLKRKQSRWIVNSKGTLWNSV